MDVSFGNSWIWVGFISVPTDSVLHLNPVTFHFWNRFLNVLLHLHCLLVTNELLLHLDFSILRCAFCVTFDTDFLVSENVTNYQNVWHILISTNLHCRLDSSLSLNISLSLLLTKLRGFDNIRNHCATCVSVLSMWPHLLNFVQHPILTQMVFWGWSALTIAATDWLECVQFILKSRCSIRSAHVTKSCHPFSISISLCWIFPELISVCKELNAAHLVDWISPST